MPPESTGCVLRAIGTDFDVDAFLADTSLDGATAFRRGESRGPDAAGESTRTASGFNVDVAEAGDDLEAQVRAARRFLRLHEDELRRLGSFEGVEEVCLDFSIRRRGRAAQSDLFPADLLWQAGALDIDLVVTHHGGPADRKPPPADV